MKKPLLVAAFLLVFAVTSLAQDNRERNSLKGLNNLHVMVLLSTSETGNHGLTDELIQTEVELRLRKAGLPVEKPIDEKSDLGTIVVTVNVLIKDTGLAVYSIKVELQQLAFLARTPRPSVPIFVTTWDKGGVGTVGIQKLRDIRTFIGDHVDFFINDFLAVNPK